MKIEWNKKYTTVAVYAVIVLVCSALLVLAGLYLRSIGSSLSKLYALVKPLFYGFVIAYLLHPLLNLLERHISKLTDRKKPHRKLTRAVSLVATYLIVLAVLSLFFYTVIPQTVASFEDLTQKITDYIPAAQKFITQTLNSSAFFQEQIARLESSLSELLSKSLDLVQWVTPHIVQYATSIVVETTNFLIGLVLSIYFLASKEKLLAQTRKLINAVFPQKSVEKIYHIAQLTHSSFGGFIIGALIDSLIIGILCLVLCVVCGIPYAPLVALIVGVTNIIPVFGPFIGAIPSAFIVFISDPGKLFWFILLIFIIQQFDGNLLKPLVWGDAVGLSALWMIVAITISASVFGLAGMIIGVPAFGVFYALAKEWTEARLSKKSLPTDTADYYVHPDDAILFRRKEKRFTLRKLAHVPRRSLHRKNSADHDDAP